MYIKGHDIALQFVGFKPWPNGVVSRRKLETSTVLPCYSVRPYLAHTCNNWCSLWLSSSLHASTCTRKFITVWPPKSSWHKLVSVSSTLVWVCVQGFTEIIGFFITCAQLASTLQVHLSTHRKSLCASWYFKLATVLLRLYFINWRNRNDHNVLTEPDANIYGSKFFKVLMSHLLFLTAHICYY